MNGLSKNSPIWVRISAAWMTERKKAMGAASAAPILYAIQIVVYRTGAGAPKGFPLGGSCQKSI